jgi:hypothetical protein
VIAEVCVGKGHAITKLSGELLYICSIESRREAKDSCGVHGMHGGTGNKLKHDDSRLSDNDDTVHSGEQRQASRRCLPPLGLLASAAQPFEHRAYPSCFVANFLSFLKVFFSQYNLGFDPLFSFHFFNFFEKSLLVVFFELFFAFSDLV